MQPLPRTTAQMELSNGYVVGLELNPQATYSIVRQTGMSQKILVSGISESEINPTMLVILDNEQPQSNVKYFVQQD